MVKPYHDPETLRKLYADDDMSTYEIGDVFDVSAVTIQKYINRHDIKKPKPWQDADTLQKLYWAQGKSQEDIADLFGVSPSTIHESMKRCGVERRRSNKNKPGYFAQADSRGHERIQTWVNGTTKQIKIHRLVAVAEHGFDAVVGNDIHHKNGVPWDNRPSNIEVLSPSEHAEIHAYDRERDADGNFA